MVDCALVTNASTFAGPAAVAGLLAAGYAVIAQDATFAELTTAATFAGARVRLLTTATADPQALVAEAVDAHGRLDVLVSNDVHVAQRATIDDASIDDLRAHLEDLVVRPFAQVKAAVAAMRPAGGARIVLITSAMALRAQPLFSMYAAARGAANELAIALGRELARANVRVNAIAPNYFENNAYYSKQRWETDERLREHVRREVPMRRLGQPEEMAKLIVFLAAGDCAFHTGQVIPFAGGWV